MGGGTDGQGGLADRWIAGSELWRRWARAGHTLSILNQQNGKWALARDANMLAPVPESGGGKSGAEQAL